MNERLYYSMFVGEPEVLTVPDVIRLLRLGKNSVYQLIKEGKIGSIKRGKKIIVPKVCLVAYLTDTKNYQLTSLLVPVNRWTSDENCDSVCIAREGNNSKSNKKGA